MSAPTELTSALCIDASHPSLPGHFPGRPVVPGVVLLDAIAATIERAGHGYFARIGTVKFLAPLGPGEAAALHVAIVDQRVRFHIDASGRTILAGEGQLA
ncbi:MAG: hydroxymyristoyl-ACP dehydratase [Rhodanobacteraceae bacterium]